MSVYRILKELRQQVQEAIDGLVESGAERGLQVAVYRQGELVVDATAGVADHETGRPVAPETPFYCYSVGKGATATVAHVLVERGAFDYDTKIVELWPEFGAHGKECATVRHALTHTVGVPGIPADTTPEDVCDWDKMCALIADSEPWWEPGTKTAYHAYTFGYIIGEIVRRATGKPISQVLREDVAAPLGIADELYFGMPESEHGRLARLEDVEGSAEMLASMPDDSPFFKLGPRAVTPTAEFGNRTDILKADIPAGGKMSARAVARMYAALLGEVGGVRLITPERLRQVSAIAYSGIDQIMGFPSTWALGYSAGQLGSDPQETPTVFGYGGVGGSYAYADTATGTTFALTKNRLTPDFGAAEQVAGIVTRAVAESQPTVRAGLRHLEVRPLNRRKEPTMPEPQILLGGLAIGESPRWREERLWFSDWGTQEIVAVDLEGNSRVMARVPTTAPFCIDWLPDGRLLVVSGPEARLLRRESDGSLVTHADLADLADKPWNDVVVDGRGNAYVGNIGFDFPDGEFAPGTLALVAPDGSARQVADEVAFPNGMAVTPDNSTLILAESYANRLTAFDIAADGGLSNRRVWAELGDGVPDGICLDAEGAVWYGDVPNRRCVRVREGGEVLQTVELDRGCFACMLGGADGRTLFMVAADMASEARTGQVLIAEAPAPGIGWP